MIKRLSYLVVIAAVLVGLLPAQFAFADSNKLYITPASSTMNVGTSFTVNVGSFAASDQSTGTATGTVLYTTSLLQVTSISVGGSAYGSPTITQGNGTIGFSGSRTPAPSGVAQVFTITFQAKAAGSATVGFNGNSQVNGQSTTFTTSTFTITQPATSPSPTPAPSNSTQPRASVAPSIAPVVTTPVTPNPADNPSTTTVTPDPTGVIDNVQVVPTYTSATVTWKVNAQNAHSTFVYGGDTSTLSKTGTVTPAAGGTYTTTITGLTPGQKYYFSITGGGTNTADGTYSSTISTEGYPVVITVTENKVLASSAQIQLGSNSYTTQSNGKVSIGLGAGSYSGTITTNTATLNINLSVTDKTIPSDGSPPPEQDFAFNLTSSPLQNGPGSGFSIFTFLGVLFGGSIVLIFGFLIFINIRRHKFDSGTDAYHVTSTGPTVIVEDGYDWHDETVQKPEPFAMPLPPPLPSEAAPHANSVYLSEEEPLDMFEQAKLHQEPATAVKPQIGIGQTPNLPHSTTP